MAETRKTQCGRENRLRPWIKDPKSIAAKVPVVRWIFELRGSDSVDGLQID
ncbi:MAG: hypothetical protein GY906_33360 [bacterium]|nr:hypothetical protein [bacterium]